MNYYVKEHNEPLLPPFCSGNTDTCNEMLEKLTYMNNDPLSIFELNLLFIFFLKMQHLHGRMPHATKIGIWQRICKRKRSNV